MIIEEIFDVLIHRHGYDEHHRDYLFQIETNWINNNHGNYILRFKNCFEMHCQLNSTDSENLDWSGTAEMAYPGFKSIENSKRATELSIGTGIDLKEILLETALYTLTLIASEFELKKLDNNSDLIDRYVFKID